MTTQVNETPSKTPKLTPFSTQVVTAPVIRSTDSHELRSSKTHFWLIIGAMILVVGLALGLGLGLGLSKQKGKNPVKPGSQGWESFDASAPWCTPTRYRYRVTVNGIVSPFSLPSPERQSFEYTNPIVEIPPNQVDVTWERMVDTGPWEFHELEFKSNGVYFDIDNPRGSLPDIGPAPEFKDWEFDAGAGQIGWCQTTGYQYRYRAGQVVSPWSPQTVVQPNTAKMNPILLAAPRLQYGTEWNITVVSGLFVWLGSLTNLNFFELKIEYPVGQSAWWYFTVRSWTRVQELVDQLNDRLQFNVFDLVGNRVRVIDMPPQFIRDLDNPNPSGIYRLTGNMNLMGFDPTVDRVGSSLAEQPPATRLAIPAPEDPNQNQFIDRVNPCTQVKGPVPPTGDTWNN